MKITIDIILFLLGFGAGVTAFAIVAIVTFYKLGKRKNYYHGKPETNKPIN